MNLEKIEEIKKALQRRNTEIVNDLNISVSERQKTNSMVSKIGNYIYCICGKLVYVSDILAAYEIDVATLYVILQKFDKDQTIDFIEFEKKPKEYIDLVKRILK
jgi:hypothetical protein